jgi:hypothetical protein
MLGEIGVVLDVECGEGNIAGNAAGRDPGVVDRPRTAAEPGVSPALAPDRGGMEAARQDDDAGEEDLEAGPAL